jgi:peptidoglycan/LPS O-acetylase OafA/YrhL
MASTTSDVSPAIPAANERMLFLDAMRAFASVMIVWHHFALYLPLSAQAEPILGRLVYWFSEYARSTQVFFVIGGYVMARSMSSKQWSAKAIRQFIAQRYSRLGIPYLGAIVLALVANAFGRGWLPDKVVGLPPELRQVVAHLFFVQEFLGYEHLSAGLWFICINFQLGLMYAAALWVRDILAGLLKVPAATTWIDVPMLAGWSLALVSLFHFNRYSAWDSWAVYFFPYFFMGIVFHRAMTKPGSQWMFWTYQLAIIAAMFYDWRWRLASAVIVGLVLFGSEKSGLSTRWPRNRAVAAIGKTSYSLFLVHFPVLVLVAGAWARLGWTSAPAAVAGLLVAFAGSVVTAFAFYRFVEQPAGALTRSR